MSSLLEYRQKRAFIIGINDYFSKSLICCVNDAKDFKNALENIGFNVNIKTNLNLGVFNQALDEFLVDLEPTDLILFYFAGLSKPYEHDNFLLLSDNTYDERKIERTRMRDHAISIQSIMKKFVEKNCIATICLFDCCRGCTNVNEIQVQSSLLSVKAPSKTLVTYISCADLVICTETGNGKNSYFMENLLKHITSPHMNIEDLLRKVGHVMYIQTKGSKLLHLNSRLQQNVFLVTNNVEGLDSGITDEACSATTSTKLIISSSNDRKNKVIERKNGIDGVEMKLTPEKDSSSTSFKNFQQKRAFVSSINDSLDAPKLLEAHGKTSSYSPNIHNIPIQLKELKPYPSEFFGDDMSISASIKTLFQYLTYNLQPMNKEGPMSNRCIRETNLMQNFLWQNFGFRNIDDKWFVPGVQAFELKTLPSQMNDNKKICFSKDQHRSFIMTVSEIKRWQNSFVVYADRHIPGMEKSFLYRALQGQSMNGREAFRMKFVVRISDCPILMKFDAEILPRSLNEDWPHRIKLISVTGIDFAGRIHDVDDITTYITNWREIYQLNPVTHKMIVFHNRDFHPVNNHPQPRIDKNRLFDDLKRMVKLRLEACNREKVQIVVETGIGLGIFSGKHIGIDRIVRILSARAVRWILETEGSSYQHIQAVIFALPIFSKVIDGHLTLDVYHDFVNEFHESKYSGRIPVLVIDQDMHELAVAIAHHGFIVSELNPADSHGIFGEYWQNYGPAVEEKLALTTLGLLTQHHIVNPLVLDTNRYHLI